MEIIPGNRQRRGPCCPQAWQARHGREFVIEDEQVVFGGGFRNLQILQG